MRQLSAQCLLDHQVDQLAGHADGLDDRLTLEPLGDGGLGGDAKGQVFEQTLENLLKNVDFGL